MVGASRWSAAIAGVPKDNDRAAAAPNSVLSLAIGFSPLIFPILKGCITRLGQQHPLAVRPRTQRTPSQSLTYLAPPYPTARHSRANDNDSETKYTTFRC